MDNTKIEQLIRLRMEIDDMTYNEALDDFLKRGCNQYHPFFHKFITFDTYEAITFDAETRTLSLIDNREKIRTSNEETMKQWRKAANRRI
jgi:hypothetical protein